jgi:hypothetical protein
MLSWLGPHAMDSRGAAEAYAGMTVVFLVRVHSAWSKSITTLSVTGNAWQLNTKPRATS